jgi:DnaK suppressor protein
VAPNLRTERTEQPVDIDVAKQRLEATLAELDRMAAGMSGDRDPGEQTDTSELDQGDAAVQLVTNDRESASLEVIEQQRERVQAALERIADGTYGKCVDCGQDLPDARLEARPEAARCVDDQRRAEAEGTA